MKLPIITVFALATLALAATAVPAFADPAPAGAGRAGKAERVFARLDADKDGRISRSEADAGGRRLARHFDRVDADKDGYVTRAELAAALARRHDCKRKHQG